MFFHVCTVICILLVSIPSLAADKTTEHSEAEEAVETPTIALVSKEEASAMSLKRVRHELKRRSLKCGDCSEKEHFVAFLLEHMHTSAVDATIPEFEDLGKTKAEHAEKLSKKANDEAKKSAEDFSDMDMDGFYETMMKKKKDDAKMKETLRKAGIDTSKFNSFGGDGASMFDSADFEKWAKKRKGATKKGKQAPAPEGKKKAPVDDDGAISDDL